MLGVINPIAFRIFGWPVHWYGIIIAIAILVAVQMCDVEAKKRGYRDDFIVNLVYWVIPFGFIGARFYYVLFELPYYLQHPTEIIAIWQGGIAIYGGLIAGALVFGLYCRHHNASMLVLLDIAAPAVLLAQAIGRWGNFINQEAHGGETTRAFLESLHLPQFIIQQMNIDGVYYHPTFLYESLWSLLGVILLLIARYSSMKLRVGDQISFYLIWYGFGRFFIEGLRTDSLYFFSTGLRVSQIVSLVILFVGIISFIYRYKKKNTYIYYQTVDNPYNIAIL
ncbi:prolipoprotein diacylglyceryl transferase [Bavariicoccus seileri]|uniref:prolipoprotein diacylglyceryl transferase n=1 Tax=Bavariicoccus seileri TaxID=549685 RepID=UPI003F92C3D0